MNVNSAGQTHDQLQAACWEWACNAYNPLIYRRLISIPNDAARGNKIAAKQLQAIGVTPGVWDMQLHWFATLDQDDGRPIEYQTPVIIPAVFWWEFKVGTDYVKPKQEEFRKAMWPLGHIFFVAKEEWEFQEQFKSVVEPTLEQAKKILKGNIL